ncbi:MAG: SLBB domain-containing protein [Bacteroidetes bacterium]|nr:SLBB domain-containing protein [Bacteroidota bacterium]
MTCLLLTTLPAFAQFDALNPLNQQSTKGADPNAALLSREVVPVARTVDPAHYYCGAGDVIALALTQPVNLEAVLPVTADGALVIPKVGAVQVAGKSLADAKTAAFDAIRKKFTGDVQGSLSLAQPRAIIVTVLGEVKSPGLLQLTAATPVSTALQMADIEKKDAARSPMALLQGETNSTSRSYRQSLGGRYFGSQEMDARALRRVVVQHADGSVSRADLTMYEATRDSKYDPFLREGDVIVVPHREVGASTISALGAVLRPGVFEFIEGDRLSDLVRMGFGLDPQKTILSAELARDGAEPMRLDVSSLRNASDDMPLKAGDRLLVYAEAPRSSGGAAVADGELRTPGVYPIVPGMTTLSQLVTMAGGFSAGAWPGLGELYRRQTGVDGFAPDQARETDRNFEKSSLVNEDTLYWAITARLREGRVAVDFHRLFVQHDPAADVTLQDGDILLVPRNTGTVYVYGQVNNSGFIPWTEGKDFAWYIEKAGGFGESATEGRAAVIKSNTRAWMDPDDAVIEPGDMLYVPHEPLVRMATTTDILAVAAAIVGGLAGIAGLVISVTR